jgi:hypothetical protein
MQTVAKTALSQGMVPVLSTELQTVMANLK